MTEMTSDEVNENLSSILSKMELNWPERKEILGAFSINPKKYSKPDKLYKLLMMFNSLSHKKAEFVVEEVLGLDDFTAPTWPGW